MNARTEFDKVNNEIIDLEQQGKELRQRLNGLTKLRDTAFRNLLIEEKLLSKKEWKLHVAHHNSHSTLVCVDKSSKWPELSAFAETNYHCSFQLEGKDIIRFDDGEISIYVNDIKHLQRIVDTYGLKVSF